MDEEEREFELMLKIKGLLDEYFDIARGDDLDKEWSDKCYDIQDVLESVEAYLERKGA